MFGNDAEPFVTYCSIEETDWLSISMIGPEGNDLSCVGISTLVVKPEGEYIEGTMMVKGIVVVTPAQARQVAAALIDCADACDGISTSFFPLQQEATDV
jgi:hypothetical protein